MIYAKLEDRFVDYQNTDNLSKEEIQMLIDDGYKLCIESEKPIIQDDRIEKMYYHLEDNDKDTYKIVYEIDVEIDNVIILIKELKQQLSATDYKVIKNMEAQMLGLDLPYNPTELNFERQPLRDKINELEKLLEDRGIVAQ